MTSRSFAPLPPRAASLQSREDTADAERARKSIAAEVYKDVWDDFYRWKAENDRQNMQELCVVYPDVVQRGRNRRLDSQNDYDFDWLSDHDYPSSYSPSSVGPEDADDLDHEMSFLTFRDSSAPFHARFIITTYGYLPEDLLDKDDDDGSFELDSYSLSVRPAFAEMAENSGIDSTFSPHPYYFSCTSTSRNLPHVGQSSTSSFSPFEDDPTFDLNRYLSPFQGFQWQVDFIDPDSKFSCQPRSPVS